MKSFTRRPSKVLTCSSPVFRIASLLLLSFSQLALAFAAAKPAGPVTPAKLSLSPQIIEFGLVVANGSAAKSTLIIKNEGGSAASKINIVRPPSSSPFSIASTTCPSGTNSLAKGASCNIVVHFLPKELGVQSHTGKISYMAGTEAKELDYQVQGTGAKGALLSVDTDNVAFGTARTSGVPIVRVVTVTNSGGVSATAFAISKPTLSVMQILKTDCPSGNQAKLEPGAQCTISYQLSPPASENLGLAKGTSEACSGATPPHLCASVGEYSQALAASVAVLSNSVLSYQSGSQKLSLTINLKGNTLIDPVTLVATNPVIDFGEVSRDSQPMASLFVYLIRTRTKTESFSGAEIQIDQEFRTRSFAPFEIVSTTCVPNRFPRAAECRIQIQFHPERVQGGQAEVLSSIGYKVSNSSIVVMATGRHSANSPVSAYQGAINFTLKAKLGAARPSIKPSASIYNRIFATSTTYDGNLGGVEGADQKCQQRAAAANLDGNWLALLGPLKTIQIDGHLYNMRGEQVTAVEPRFWSYQYYPPIDGQFKSAVKYDEFGDLIPAADPYVLSGSSYYGYTDPRAEYSDNCNFYTTTSDEVQRYSRYFGSAIDAHDTLQIHGPIYTHPQGAVTADLNNAVRSCAWALRLYCVETREEVGPSDLAVSSIVYSNPSPIGPGPSSTITIRNLGSKNPRKFIQMKFLSPSQSIERTKAFHSLALLTPPPGQSTTWIYNEYSRIPQAGTWILDPNNLFGDPNLINNSFIIP